MSERNGAFAGDDPFDIARAWLEAAKATEPNDPNAMALATVDAAGLPDVRMVLLKAVDGQGAEGSFVFYTNYTSAKGQEIEATGVAAFVMHWKSLRRQIRVRGTVMREEGAEADAYFRSRALQSRIGAWASAQSQVLASRAELMGRVAAEGLRRGPNPTRPPFWGGYRIRPVQIEFWADGAFRLHDRFVWHRLEGGREALPGAEIVTAPGVSWGVSRLSP